MLFFSGSTDLNGDESVFPVSLMLTADFWSADHLTLTLLPFFKSPALAGFPSRSTTSSLDSS